MKRAPKPKNVDAYIAAAPKAVRAKLNQLRSIITKTAPEAGERISYGIPFYEYKGRLAYFSAWKSHIGLYLPTPILQEHKSELTAYETTKATVRFPLHRKLPPGLIRKLIRARLKKNDARRKK